MKSIMELHCECPRCHWNGALADTEAGWEGDPMCPECWTRVVIEDGSAPSARMVVDYARLPKAPVIHIERSSPPSFQGAPRWYYKRGANFGRLAAGPLIFLFRMPWLEDAARALHPECCSAINGGSTHE